MTRQDSEPEKLAATLQDALADTQESSQNTVRQFLSASVAKGHSGVLSVRSSGSFASSEAKRVRRTEVVEDKPSATATASAADMTTQEQQFANKMEAMAILLGIASQVTKQNEVLADMQKNMKTVMGEVFDDKMKPLENRMNLLEEKIALCSTSGSSVGAGTGSATGMKHMSVPAPRNFDHSSMDFVPRWVEIKGWVSNFQTRAGALQEGQVNEWLGAAKVAMEHRAENKFCDWGRTMRLSGRVLFTKMLIWIVPGTSKDDIYELRDVIKEICDGQTINSMPTRVVAEPAPWRKAYNAAAAKSRNFLIENGVKADELKTEWGPPLRIYHFAPGGGISTIGCFTPDDGWKITSDVFTSVVNDGVTERDFYKASS